MTRCLLWDFDNTLAFRREGGFRSAMSETLDQKMPGHRIEPDDLRIPLRDGFPWHEWNRPHLELSSPDLWWNHVEKILKRAYESVGIDPERATRLGHFARKRYVDPSSFELFPDTVPVLQKLTSAGWQHIILSNHVPELTKIVEHLGLNPLISRVLCSAETGFEKPHPESYRLAKQAAGNPDTLWMIGDNPDADVRGAEQCGIPAILVRNVDSSVKRSAKDLFEVMAILGEKP